MGRRAKSALSLSALETARLHARLGALTCSSRWAEDLYQLILHRRAPYRSDKSDLYDALRHCGEYPPGGDATAMIDCRRCRRPTPPNTIGSAGICLDCYYARMPVDLMVQIPSSPRFTWTMPDQQIPAQAQGITRRRSRRTRYKFDDPNITGGWVDGDGAMHELGQ